MVRIRKYKAQDARLVAGLIGRTYWKFNRNEGSAQAVRAYVEMYNPKGKKTTDIHSRLSGAPIFLVVVDGSRIVGVVRGFESRLISLFVSADYHRRGVATRLVERFESTCSAGGFKVILVRASLYAISFYESRGYTRTTGIRRFHGIKVQPMRKRLE
jgi:GNAT superfamily N-acetyltransferase